MKYGQTILTLAALSMAACANDKSPSTAASQKNLDVMGTYRYDGSTKKAKAFLTVGANSVTLKVVCNDGEKTSVEVTAPARVTDSVIEVLQSVQKAEPLGGHGCVAKLDKGLVPFSMNKFQDLLLMPPNQEEQSFTKMGVPEAGFVARAKEGIKNFAVSADQSVQKDVGSLATGVYAPSASAASTVGTATTKAKEVGAVVLKKTAEFMAEHPIQAAE